jgi:putative ABC transport system permease protein
MSKLRGWIIRLGGFFSRRPNDQSLEDEIESHLQMQTEDNLRLGLSPEEARRQAVIKFGSIEAAKEAYRDQRSVPALETLRQDLRYACRMFCKNPAFSAVAVITLALGIGANTAIFSVCNAVLLNPLPYAEPDRIVILWERKESGTLQGVAPANFVDWRTASRSFSEMAALKSSSFILSGQNDAVQLAGAGVSSNFLSLLGVRLAMGRSFLPEEDLPGQNRVAILSHRIWQERFGADQQITGKQITLDDNSYRVVGVLPVDFKFASNAADFEARSQADVWVPIALDSQNLQRGTHPLRVIARLKPGMELSQAQAELNVTAANLAQLYPENNRGKGIVAVPLTEQITANVKVALRTLLGAVGLLLLIACANVANLLLSRAATREREMTVRVALGASRMRLAKQLMTESLFLASIGGIAGLFLALAATWVLSSHLPADLSRAAGLTVDARVLLFTAAISLATGILFGVVPLLTGRVNLGESLKQSNRVTDRLQSGVRNGLAVTQIAIAIVLLIGAGLMAKSFWTLVHVEPGFRTENIMTAQLSLPKSRYPDNRRIAAFERELLESLRGRSGVQSAGFATYLPLSGSDNDWSFFILGRPPLPIGTYNMAKYRPVSAGYFETIGIPLLRGRSFAQSDTADSQWVVIINNSMAHEYWGTENPIGQQLHFAGPTPRTVIGIVGDVRHEGLNGGTKPEMYVPVEQAPRTEGGPILVVRTSDNSGVAAAELRAAISAIDYAIPIDRIETMDQIVSGSVAQPRFRTIIFATFSLLALVMASIGIYGVMNYLVIQRTREFGIRLSLGASQTDVLRLVLGRAAKLIAVGTCLGLAGSVFLTRWIASFLFGTTPLDQLTFIVVPMLLGVVALAASYVPARRATQVDPMVVLRSE